LNKCLLYPRSLKGEGGILFYLCPSVQDIFRRIFLSNCWWEKSDIWSQASYRYTILWVAFLDPSDSYFLFADLVDFYTHWTYMLIFRHPPHRGCAGGRIGTRFLRPRSTSPLKEVNPAGTPGYRNGTESFFGLKGRPSVVRDVEIHNQPVLRMRRK
jgi:hypothetical protein